MKCFVSMSICSNVLNLVFPSISGSIYVPLSFVVSPCFVILYAVSNLTLCRIMKNKVKVLFYSVLPYIRKSTALFEGCQALPACPSDYSNIETKMSTELW